MTSAFDTFMRQYAMTGSEKADGYSRDAFIGLTEAEKTTVFALLERELPFSTEWLFFVDPVRARAVAKEMEKQWRGDGYRHVYLLQEYLVHYTGETQYQAHAIADYQHYADYLKPLVVDAIGRMPANEATVAFLQDIIATETNLDAADRAARRLSLLGQRA